MLREETTLPGAARCTWKGLRLVPDAGHPCLTYLLPLPPGIKNLLRPGHVVHHAVAPLTGYYSVMKVWCGDMRVGTSRHLTSLVRDAPPTEAGAPARDILHVGCDAERELCSARFAIPLHACGLSRVTYRCGPAIGVTLQQEINPSPTMSEFGVHVCSRHIRVMVSG